MFSEVDLGMRKVDLARSGVDGLMSKGYRRKSRTSDRIQPTATAYSAIDCLARRDKWIRELNQLISEVDRMNSAGD